MKISRNILRELAESCLKTSSSGKRKNTCDVVSNEIACRLEEEYDITAYAPVLAPVEGSGHYVCLVPSEECCFSDKEGFVIVDATVRQFQDIVERELKDFEIITPSSDRTSIYDNIENVE